MSGLEALMRWTDTESGNIPPSDFIPLAEETGLIVQMGDFALDRLFVESTAKSQTDRLMVEHIIHMAHSLGMKVVAEGVETEEQLSAPRALDCDQVQGYLFAKPMNAAKIEELLVQQAKPSISPEAGESAAEDSRNWGMMDSHALGLV